MKFDFELILFYATVVCGLIALADVVYFAPRRKKKGIPAEKMPIVIDYARSFFPVLLIVFLLRSFLYEPFVVPSGSLEPTLLTGEFILVNKFDYGVRVPILHTKIIANQEPKHGDIVVFHYPLDPSIYYIKRVIGVPGDRISYVNKILYVNGQKMPQTFEKYTTDQDDNDDTWDVVQKQEDFFGLKHYIYQIPARAGDDFENLEVPQGMYFMMGDNRDDSADSREWGFVPETNIVGKAKFVWMSWDKHAGLSQKIRWNRIGTVIH